MLRPSISPVDHSDLEGDGIRPSTSFAEQRAIVAGRMRAFASVVSPSFQLLETKKIIELRWRRRLDRLL